MNASNINKALSLPGLWAQGVVRNWVHADQLGEDLPIPPGGLIKLVAGTRDVRWFLHSGRLAAKGLREIIGRHGIELGQLGAILDFGCGAGRVIRQWKSLEGPALYGTDVNPRLVRWCASNLSFAQFASHPLEGPLPFEAESFDLVYALSVLTHLSSALQRTWMQELARVLRPGGLLFLTLHGEAYLERLRFAEAEQFRQGRLVVRGEEAEGRNRCAAFHPEAYVRAHLAQGFELLEFVPQGAIGNPTQDVYLFRKPARPLR